MLKQICVTLLITFSVASHGIMNVEDAAVLVEQTKTTANTLEMRIQQAEMLINQVEMLQNQAKNLAQAPNMLYYQLQDKVNRLLMLVERTRALSYQWEIAEQQFRTIFPGWEYYAQQSSTDYAARVYWWRKEVEQSILDAAEAQSIVGSSDLDAYNLQTSISASDQATGALSAIQAGNQIGSLVVSHLMDLKQIIAGAHRQQSLYLQQQMSSNEMDAARAKRQIQDWGEPGERDVMSESEYMRFAR